MISRRNFLAISAATLSTISNPMRHIRAQPASNRAAVIIGVNKAGNLPVLNAAVQGAKSIAQLLAREAFSIKLFVDDTKPVRASDIFEAIAGFVNAGTFDQLVVYFSGHGFLNHYSEYWLLSHAPGNPNEAISLVESAYNAKLCGIPNVVFISDACRSTPDSLKASHVRGSVIFPSQSTAVARGDVDKFLATLPGRPAFEISVTQSVNNFEGIFTACFLDAFKHPDPHMVQTLSDGKRVVPNRKLPTFLVREVQKKAQAKSIKLVQIPDADVVSDDSTYIAKLPIQTGIRDTSDFYPPEAITDISSIRLRQVGIQTRPILQLTGLGAIPSRSNVQFTHIQRKIAKSEFRGRFETGAGVAVFGAQVHHVVTDPSISKASILNTDTSRRTLIGIGFTDQRQVHTAVVQFKDGSAAVVALLPGFVCNIVVEQGSTINVSYRPNSSADGSDHEQRLNKLRATVGSAVQFGVFRFDGDRETRARNASNLARKIRVLKGVDPTLGLYAAYAYHEADLIHDIRSVQRYMRYDSDKVLFDIALLAGNLGSGSRKSTNPLVPDSVSAVVPFCPLLSQGWALLRVKGVQLAPEIEEARNHLLPALWTTFDSTGARIVADFVQAGKG